MSRILHSEEYAYDVERKKEREKERKEERKKERNKERRKESRSIIVRGN